MFLRRMTREEAIPAHGGMAALFMFGEMLYYQSEATRPS
jgi:hypothetical protein